MKSLVEAALSDQQERRERELRTADFRERRQGGWKRVATCRPSLSDEQIRDLRRRVARGESRRKIRVRLGLGQGYFDRLVRGDSRREAGGPFTRLERGGVRGWHRSEGSADRLDPIATAKLRGAIARGGGR